MATLGNTWQHLAALIGALVLFPHFSPAVEWKEVEGCLVASFGSTAPEEEEKARWTAAVRDWSHPLALLLLPTNEIGTEAADPAQACFLLPPEVREWLLRLGVFSQSGDVLTFRHRLSVTCVVQQANRYSFADAVFWWYRNDVPSGPVAIKWIPLSKGQIAFAEPWDFGPGAGASRVRSLPNGFLLRKFPSEFPEEDEMFLLKISGAGEEEPFAYASLVLDTAGDARVAVEIIPARETAYLRNPEEALEALLKRFANADHPCWQKKPVSREVPPGSAAHTPAQPTAPLPPITREKFEEQVRARNDHFLGDALRPPENFAKAPLTQGEKMGEGNHGEVYAAQLRAGGKDRDVILKIPKSKTEIKWIREEMAHSGALVEAAAQQIARFQQEEQKRKIPGAPECGAGETDLAKFQGFRSVVKVLGTGPFVKIQNSDSLQSTGVRYAFSPTLVQDRIHGENLNKALQDTPVATSPEERSAPYKNSFYGPDGFPCDLQEAKQRALEFAAAVMAIHAAGKVHNDIKSLNVMLDREGYVYVVDLGAMKTCGNGMGEKEDVLVLIGPNSGPEFFQVEERYEQAKQELKRMAGCAPCDKIQVEEEVKRAWQEVKSFVVHPSLDIYAEGSVLPMLLFGKAGLEWSEGRSGEGLFCSRSERSKKYLQETKDMSHEERTAYFRRALEALNRQLQVATWDGRLKVCLSYTDAELGKLSELMAWMMDPKPEHRPDAERVFTHLLDLHGMIKSGNEHFLKKELAEIQALAAANPAATGPAPAGES